MRICPLSVSELPHLRELHDKYYSEFEFPQFGRYPIAFGVKDDDDKLVIAGGIELIGEVVLVTDRSKNMVTVGRALKEAQRCALLAAGQLGVHEIVAFVKDEGYARHLVKHGFTPRSQALSMKV